MNTNMDTPNNNIDWLEGLSTRAANVITAAGISSRTELLEKVTSGEMSKLRNYGSKTHKEVSQWLYEQLRDARLGPREYVVAWIKYPLKDAIPDFSSCTIAMCRSIASNSKEALGNAWCQYITPGVQRDYLVGDVAVMEIK